RPAPSVSLLGALLPVLSTKPAGRDRESARRRGVAAWVLSRQLGHVPRVEFPPSARLHGSPWSHRLPHRAAVPDALGAGIRLSQSRSRDPPKCPCRGACCSGGIRTVRSADRHPGDESPPRDARLPAGLRSVLSRWVQERWVQLLLPQRTICGAAPAVL